MKVEKNIKKVSGGFDVWLSVFTDDGKPLMINQIMTVKEVPNDEKIVEIVNDLMSQQLEEPEMEIRDGISDLDNAIIKMKNEIKAKAVGFIKSQENPTEESLVNFLQSEGYDVDLVRFLAKAYMKEAYEKGYISSPSWEALINDIKNTPIEELLARR